jgi:hypothetical protein
MATVVEELIAVLGLDVDEASFNQGTTSISGIIDKLGGIATGAIAAGFGMVSAFNSSTAEVKNMADAMGVSSQMLENMGALVKPLGMDFENVADLIEEMNNKIGESKGLEELAPVEESLDILGLGFQKIKDLSPEEQFRAIANAATEMGDSQAAVAAVDILMGGEANKIIGLMRSTGKSFDELMEKQNKMNFQTDRSRQGAVDWIASWNRLISVGTSVGKFFSGLIGEALTPYVDKVVDMVASTKEWMHLNADRVIKAMAIAFKVLAAMSAVFLAMKVYKGILLMKNAFIAARVAVLAFQASAFLVPLAIAAIVAAIVLLGQDIWKYFSSGGKADTAFGRLLDKFPMLKKAIDRLSARFSKLSDKFSAAWNKMKSSMKPFFDLFEGSGDKILSILGEIVWFLAGALVSAVIIFINLIVAAIPTVIATFELVGAIVTVIGQALGWAAAQAVLFAQYLMSLRADAITLVGQALTALQPVFNMVGAAIQWVIAQVNILLGVLGAIAAVVRAAVNSAIGSFNQLVEAAAAAWSTIRGIFSAITGAVGAVGAKISSALSFAGGLIGIGDVSASQVSAPAVSQAKGGSITNSTKNKSSKVTNNRNTTNITIKGGNTKKVAATVRKEMNRANSVAAKNNSSGQEY